MSQKGRVVTLTVDGHLRCRLREKKSVVVQVEAMRIFSRQTLSIAIDRHTHRLFGRFGCTTLPRCRIGLAPFWEVSLGFRQRTLAKQMMIFGQQ